MAFVGVSQPRNQCPDEGYRFIRLSTDRIQEFGLGIGRTNGVVRRDDRCGARPAVDQSHLSENLAGTQSLVPSVGKLRFDASNDNQKRTVAPIASLEDRFPRVECFPIHLVSPTTLLRIGQISKTDDTGRM